MEGRAGNCLPAGFGSVFQPLTCLTSREHPCSSMKVSASCSLRKPGGDGAFQTFNRSRIQLPRTQGQEAQQSLLRTEIMYFLTKEYISASHCLIHFSRAVIIIVFVS